MSKDLPANAKRVFQGIIFDVYQWQQQMFDGNEKTFEVLTRPDTVCVIATTADQKIIVIEEEQPGGREPFITIPGGRNDKDEDSLTAAKRELLEETGMTSDSWQLWFSEQPLVKIKYSVHFFIAKHCQLTSEQRLDDGEKITIKSVTMDEFIDLWDSPEFHYSQIATKLLQAKYESEKRAEIEKLFF
jgi:ADP-ribose pyrophosphatase